MFAKKPTHNVEVDAVAYHRSLANRERAIESRLFVHRLGRLGSEIIRLAITAIVIFIVTFVGLNFGAYAKQIAFWWHGSTHNTLTSTALKSDLTAVTPTTDDALATTTPAVTPEAPLVIARTTIKKEIDIPTVDLAVEPPTSFVFIPRLDIRAPIHEAAGVDFIGDWSYVEKQIQKTLQDGVVHFPGTAEPGERGNAFLTGHSSYYPWDPGRYKDIFALLPKIEVGDTIETYHGEKKFIYRVTDKKEVSPQNTDVLAPTDDYRLTLMTCTPVGTALHRLIVTAHLVENPS